jgi:hypothetical protein
MKIEVTSVAVLEVESCPCMQDGYDGRRHRGRQPLILSGDWENSIPFRPCANHISTYLRSAHAFKIVGTAR